MLSKFVLPERWFKLKSISYCFNSKGLLWESVTLCLPIPLVPVTCPWVRVVTIVEVGSLLNVIFIYFFEFFEIPGFVITVHALLRARKSYIFNKFYRLF